MDGEYRSGRQHLGSWWPLESLFRMTPSQGRPFRAWPQGACAFSSWSCLRCWPCTRFPEAPPPANPFRRSTIRDPSRHEPAPTTTRSGTWRQATVPRQGDGTPTSASSGRSSLRGAIAHRRRVQTAWGAMPSVEDIATSIGRWLEPSHFGQAPRRARHCLSMVCA